MKHVQVSILVLCFNTLLMAQDKFTSQPTGSEDYAVALAWKAVPGLVWTTMNYGRIFNGRAETDFYWPLRTHTTDGQHANTSSIIFAVEDNVIESYSQNRAAPQDWMPKDGSLQKEGNVTSGIHTDKWLILGSTGSFVAAAHSDVPTGPTRSWPLRVDPRDGVAKPWWPGILPEGFDELSRFDTEAPWAVADREIYMVFNDKYNINKPSLGVEIEEQIYNYGRSFAKDFSFVYMRIHNTSDKPIRGAYFGYYFQLKDDIGGFNDDYLVAMNSGWNPDPTKPDLFYVYDPQRDRIPAGHEPAVAAIAVLETPKNMGITDFHFFEPPGPLTDEGMWAVISSNPDDPDLPGDPSQYFHDTGPDHRIDNTDWIPKNKPQGSYWAFIAMTGPFDLEPGEVVTASWGPVAGSDEADLLEHVKVMHDMARNGFRGPSPPPQPKLSAVAGDRRVILYWDDRAERHPLFEGYKIYRRESSSIAVAPWGEDIMDAEGNVVGVRPLAQFDKANGIKGPDPLNPYFWLGNDTGLRHTFVDTTVFNGVSYQYAITAYSRSDPTKDLPPLENALGGGIVGAMPQPPPNGTVLGHAPEGALKITPDDSFWVEVEVLDPQRITGHTYQVTFSDWTNVGVDSLYKQGFNLYDVTEGRWLGRNLPLTDASGDNVPVIDGFRLKFVGRVPTGAVEKVWNRESQVADGSRWPYWDLTLRSAARGLDFVFVIDEANPVSMPAFRGFGKATYQVPLRVFVNNTGEELSPYLEVGDWATRFPDNPDYGQPPGAWSLEPGGPNWNPIIDRLGNTSRSDFIVGKDASGRQLFLLQTIQPPDSRAPRDGDRWFVGEMKPFPRDAVYVFETTRSYVDPQQIDLSRVRAVPNPYYVKARWDTEANFRTIRFMNLPEVCDIYIFTVAGDLVRHIKHRQDFLPPPNPDNPGPFFRFTKAGLGFHDWELVSDNEIEVAYGIYIYVVVTPDGRKTTGKLAIIR
ncbi:MAG: hypothetical protein D6813_07765 [Calditrichaeota bacterium]|nr:MAG: hypothetical protein D6813_07765 [Calditrichota bacterium]